METTFNGDMLRIARKAKGFPQGVLAAAVGAPQGTYSKIENALQAPSPELVKSLASALGVRDGFFFQQGGVYQPVTPYHRSRASLPVKVKDHVEAMANMYGLHVAKMMEELDLTYNIAQVAPMDLTPAQVAEITRRNLRLPRGPIVDLTKTLEDHGLFVIAFPFETSQLDGFTVHGHDIVPMVFINESAPADRKRFTLAHELGHLVMHAEIDGLANIEREANEFASSLLMPKEDIQHELYELTIEKLAALKMKWRVSMAALIHRAKDLGTITAQEEKNLWIRMSVVGYRRKEPVEIPSEKPGLVKEMLERYTEDLGYSKKELATLLLISEQELDRYFEFGRFKLKIVNS